MHSYRITFQVDKLLSAWWANYTLKYEPYTFNILFFCQPPEDILVDSFKDRYGKNLGQFSLWTCAPFLDILQTHQ